MSDTVSQHQADTAPPTLWRPLVDSDIGLATEPDGDRPAIAGGTPTRGPYLVFGAPAIHDTEIAEVVATLRSGWIGTGPKTAEFERSFAAYVGARHAVAVSSCTAALHISLVAAGIRPGDAVVVPAMTFVATANSVVHAGATPVLCDVDRRTHNVRASDIEARITARTRAIIPVHFAGRPVDMTAIRTLAQRHNLAIISDAAHAIEAEHCGRNVAQFADLTTYSFYPTKNLTTGEGGMVVTDDDRLADIARSWRLHGLSADAWTRFADDGYKHYAAVVPGFKCNMTDLAASLGLHQLARLDELARRRALIWQRYDDAFADLPPELPLPVPDGDRHARHLYTVVLDLERIEASDSTFSRKPADTLAFLDALHRRLELARVDVIHAHAAVPALVGLRLATRHPARPPVVHTMHGWSRQKPPAFAAADLAVMRDVDQLVFPSVASRDELLALGLARTNSAVIPHGIDACASAVPFACPPPLAAARARGARVLATVGSLTAEKNHVALIEALPEILMRHDAVAVLVGEGPETAALASRASALGVAESVFLLGYRTEASTVLTMADLLIQPSFTESLGMAVIEAFRAGVPVVASNIPALAALVRPGDTGWRFDPADTESLTAAVCAALDTPDRHRAQIIARAQALFNSDFTRDRMVQSYATAYEGARMV